MFRQLALRQASILRTTAARTQISAARNLSHTGVKYSVIDSAKEALSKANKKIGEVAAEGLEKAEKAAPNASNASEAAEKVNKKTGEVLADGLQKAEDTIPVVNKKTGEAADKVSEKAGEAAQQAKEKTGEAASKLDEHAQKQRVKQNTKGYKDLQDKGGKVETEQNRPDDAV